jgi:hypothetical protein
MLVMTRQPSGTITTKSQDLDDFHERQSRHLACRAVPSDALRQNLIVFSIATK